MKFFSYFFTQLFSKVHPEIVLASSLTVVMATLLLGVFFGYVSWETSDSLFQDTSLINESEVQTVYIKRSVFFISMVCVVGAFLVAYNSALPGVDGTVLVSPQPVVVYSSVLQNISIGLGLSNDTVFNIVNPLVEHLSSKDASIFLPHFDALFSNIKNSAVDLTGISPDIKAFFVRALVRIYADSDFFKDVVLPGAEVYTEAPSFYNKRGLPFIYYIIAIILGHKF